MQTKCATLCARPVGRATSLAGLAGLTKGTKVTVNSVLPGPTRSEGIIDFLKSIASDPEAPSEQIEAEFFAKARPSSLLQRMIEPDEIANLVAYVASPVIRHQWRRASRRRRRYAHDQLRAIPTPGAPGLNFRSRPIAVWSHLSD
jgi:hypothetical protein